MSSEILVALFGGTGLSALVAVVYQVVKERRQNAQRDLEGDLTLGELFRAAARKEVVLAYEEIDRLRDRVQELEAQRDDLERALRETRSDHQPDDEGEGSR